MTLSFAYWSSTTSKLADNLLNIIPEAEYCWCSMHDVKMIVSKKTCVDYCLVFKLIFITLALVVVRRSLRRFPPLVDGHRTFDARHDAVHTPETVENTRLGTRPSSKNGMSFFA